MAKPKTSISQRLRNLKQRERELENQIRDSRIRGVISILQTAIHHVEDLRGFVPSNRINDCVKIKRLIADLESDLLRTERKGRSR